MVFQDPARSLNPTMRVGAQITEAVRSHLTLSARGAGTGDRTHGLVRIPLPRRRFADYPHQLSGGMRQRLMIAIALACRPKLLIADEATTSLDVTTQAQIMELLLDLQAELGMALMLISHDLGLAASYADEVIVMYAGGIVEQATASQLFSARPDALHAGAAGGDAAAGAARALPAAGDRRAAARPGPCRQGARSLPAAAGRRTMPGRRAALAEHEPGHRWACWHPVQRRREHDVVASLSCSVAGLVSGVRGP